MAKRLPWFPFYVNDFIDNERVLALNNEQRGIYLWLLCRQWMLGSLPYDVGDVYALMPPNTNTAATSFVFLSFFPADPDTNRRRNPRLEVVRQEQEATAEANRTRTAKARASVTRAVTGAVTATKTEPETEPKTEGDVPTSVLTAASGYLSSHTQARVGLLRGMLQGITDRPVSEDVIVRALRDMAAAGTNFTPVILRTWCVRAEKEIQGEAGRREALSPVLRQPDAKQAPSEDDL